MSAPPTIRECIRLVSERTKTPVKDLLGGKRHQEIVRPRQLAMWLARVRTGKSYGQIGRAFKRDHTSVMNGIARIEQLRETDGEIATICGELEPKTTQEWAPAEIPMRRADLMAAAAGMV